jgi:hypothetical protein
MWWKHFQRIRGTMLLIYDFHQSEEDTLTFLEMEPASSQVGLIAGRSQGGGGASLSSR